jgi:hypothetical protein
MSPQPGPIQGSSANRRLHERLSVDFHVHLCWQDPQGNQVLRARAVDISKFGLLVEAERPITPGTSISVQTNSITLGTACVRHCTPKGLNYRIGLHMPDRMAGDFQVRRAAVGATEGLTSRRDLADRPPAGPPAAQIKSAAGHGSPPVNELRPAPGQPRLNFAFAAPQAIQSPSMSLKLYTVTLDLLSPGDYGPLKSRLRSLGAHQILANQWALRSTYTAAQLKEIFRAFTDSQDRIVVTEVGGECASRRALVDIGSL